MALSNKLKGYLTRMNTSSKQAKLGLLLQKLISGIGIDLAAGSILKGSSAGVSEVLDASGDAKLLLGDGAQLASVAMSGDATIDSAGVVSISNDAVGIPDIDKDEVDIDLLSVPVQFAGVKTDGNIEEWLAANGNNFRCLNIGDKTADATWVRGTGIDTKIDGADNDGSEITVDGSASGCGASFVAGTDNFFVEAKISVADVSEYDEVYVGFRKAEAFAAVFDNYKDAVAVNVNNGAVHLESILDNGATADVDTTDSIADGEYIISRIEHSSVVGLSSAITLMTEAKIDYNAHLADAAQHTTAVDAANVLAEATPVDLVSLIASVTELLTKFDVHEGDSELAAAWLYHDAQETGDCSLASAVAPTDLPECITKLNDFKTKFKTHDDDATSHAIQTQHAISAVSASSVTFETGVNAALAAPTVTTQFTFDDAEEVVPFIRLLKDAAGASVTVLSSFKCGRL